MRVSIRIVAGSLKGRRLSLDHNPDLRPTPQMVREAFFSILGNAVPGRPFVDIFAGTGVVGLEALSRGAAQTLFVERDFRLAQDIEKHLRTFGLGKQSRLYRTDAYRWIAAWQAPAEPVNVFLSPPFADLEERPEEMVKALTTLQERVAAESVVVLQGERASPLEDDPVMVGWEQRHYGRNVLFIWQKE
ncbi:MAG: RsmD family RNA methyltransferase [Planctomycetes bacterium]|nr:RsmD family RNA methyltransferase [Planctomycetota bacterium]